MGISASLFGSMQASVAGLNAQAAAVSYVSDNIANAQTAGYKRVEARFGDLIVNTNVLQSFHTPGGVAVNAFFNNTLQGALTQVNSPTNVAISGGGFFEISRTNGVNTTTGGPTFEAEHYYTRKGDFNLDRYGYLKNSVGLTLRGWPRNASTGVITQVSTEIVIQNTPLAPNSTTQASISVNLPASSTTQAFVANSAQFQNSFQVYDSLGNAQTVNLNWTHTTTGTWAIEVQAVSNGATQTFGNSNSTFTFNTSGTVTTPGQFSAGNVNNSLTLTTSSINGATHNIAQFQVTTFPGAANQTISLDLGAATGNSNTLTQYSATTLTLNALSQNGYGPGQFKGVSVDSQGIVYSNYDNGQSIGTYVVPLANFADPNKLGRLDGDSFQITTLSGPALLGSAGTGGRGSVTGNALEASNTDIADEFTKMIVAQRTYTANSKMINVADEMLQEAVNLKR